MAFLATCLLFVDNLEVGDVSSGVVVENGVFVSCTGDTTIVFCTHVCLPTYVTKCIHTYILMYVFLHTYLLANNVYACMNTY